MTKTELKLTVLLYSITKKRNKLLTIVTHPVLKYKNNNIFKISLIFLSIKYVKKFDLTVYASTHKD